MKKEILAVALLILVFAAAILNILYLEHRTQELLSWVDTSTDLAAQGQWQEATEAAKTALDTWEGMAHYTHIFIRHSEIDSTTYAFYQLLTDLYAQDYPAVKGNAQALSAHVENIAAMEHVTLGNVF